MIADVEREAGPPPARSEPPLAHGARHGVVEVALDGSQPDEVVLAVKNQGVIPTELMPQSFDAFRRGARSHSTGLGLGLYIVKEITVAHGVERTAGNCTVAVTSTALDGTRFEVRLPRHLAPRPAHTASQKPA